MKAKHVEAMKLALEALDDRISLMKWQIAREALREALAEQPAYRAVKTFHEGKPVYVAEQPAQQEPVAWADKCRIELVIAIHFLASDFENALGAFGGDIEARRKAEGDIAHARSVASRWNWNGTSPPAQRTWVGLTDEQIDRLWSQSLADTESETWLPLREFARAIEAAHGITKE